MNFSGLIFAIIDKVNYKITYTIKMKLPFSQRFANTGKTQKNKEFGEIKER